MKTFYYSALVFVKVDFRIEANSFDEAEKKIDDLIQKIELSTSEGDLAEVSIEHLYHEKTVDYLFDIEQLEKDIYDV